MTQKFYDATGPDVNPLTAWEPVIEDRTLAVDPEDAEIPQYPPLLKVEWRDPGDWTVVHSLTGTVLDQAYQRGDVEQTLAPHRAYAAEVVRARINAKAMKEVG
jgi:hypothetical protein